MRGFMSDLDRATLRASLPPIMSAIKAGGDGMRVQFDIPESDMAEAIKLMQWRGVVLKITIEPETTSGRPKSTGLYPG